MLDSAILVHTQHFFSYHPFEARRLQRPRCQGRSDPLPAEGHAISRHVLQNLFYAVGTEQLQVFPQLGGSHRTPKNKPFPPDNPDETNITIPWDLYALMLADLDPKP
jgi:hypothetical protein